MGIKRSISRSLIAVCICSMFALTGCGAGTEDSLEDNSNNEMTETVSQEDTEDVSEDGGDNSLSDDTQNDNSKDAQADNSDSSEVDSSGSAASGYSFNGQSFVITLYPENAPETCENFEKLVEQGFYNGLTFHRVVDEFMAQGGDPLGNGTGGSEDNIKGEFSSNGVDNTLSHKRGVISMARSQDPDSASSQFFICYTDCSFLDGEYAAFGEVTEGMEVVDGFLEVPRSYGGDGAISSPDTPIVMDKVEMIEADENGNPRVQITMK